jgi:hypothetical protein
MGSPLQRKRKNAIRVWPVGAESRICGVFIGREWGWNLPRILFCYVLPAVVLTPMLIYSPLTAADGKIPLSMVQVKSKPLYVVFSSQLPA